MNTKLNIVVELQKIEKELLVNLSDIQTAIKVLLRLDGVVDTSKKVINLLPDNHNVVSVGPALADEKRICDWHECGKEFTPIRKDQKFCSKICSQRGSQFNFKKRKEIKKNLQPMTTSTKNSPN